MLVDDAAVLIGPVQVLVSIGLDGFQHEHVRARRFGDVVRSRLGVSRRREIDDQQVARRFSGILGSAVLRRGRCLRRLGGRFCRLGGRGLLRHADAGKGGEVQHQNQSHQQRSQLLHFENSFHAKHSFRISRISSWVMIL